MPTPREAYMNTVEAAPLSGQRVATADYGAAGEIMGRAVQGFGQNVQKVGQDLDDIQTIYAQAAAKDALVQALPRLSAIRQGFDKLQKKDATGARDLAVADIDALETEMVGQLKDKRAQTMFRDAFLERKISTVEAVGTHEMKEVLAYNKDMDVALLGTAQNMVADSFGDDNEIAVHLKTIDDIVVRQNTGAAPEEISFKQGFERSKALAMAAERIDDPMEQNDFITRYADKIDPVIETKLRAGNAAGLFDAESHTRKDAFLADFFGGAAATPETPAVGKPASAPGSVVEVKGADYHPTGRLGRITDRFGTQRGAKIHGALDVAVAEGTPITPPIRGKVIEKGYEEKKSGHFVKVRFADGQVGSWSHMRGQSPLKEGDEVDRGTVVGSVGNTGHSTGAHVHYKLRDAKGNLVDPEKATYRDDGRGVDIPSKLATQARPEIMDTAALYQATLNWAKAKKLGWRETERLVKDVDAFAARSEAQFRQREEIVDRSVQDQLTALEASDKPFDASQLKGINSASPTMRARVSDSSEASKKPHGVDEDTQTWFALREMKEIDPEMFASKDHNLERYKGKITERQLSDLRIEQAKLRNKDGTPDRSAIQKHDVINERISTYMKMADPKISGVQGNIDKRDEIAHREEARTRIQQEIIALEAKNGGKPLEYTQIDNIVRNAMTVVHFTRAGKKEAALRYSVRKNDPAIENPTIDGNARARYELTKALGYTPNEQQIADYRKKYGL